MTPVPPKLLLVAAAIIGTLLARMIWAFANEPDEITKLDEAMARANEAERQKLAQWWVRKQQRDPKVRRWLWLTYTKGERERMKVHSNRARNTEC